MDDDARRALRLRMEKGQQRRSVLIDPEEVLGLLDEIDRLRNTMQTLEEAARAAYSHFDADWIDERKDRPVLRDLGLALGIPQWIEEEDDP